MVSDLDFTLLQGVVLLAMLVNSFIFIFNTQKLVKLLNKKPDERLLILEINDTVKQVYGLPYSYTFKAPQVGKYVINLKEEPK